MRVAPEVDRVLPDVVLLGAEWRVRALLRAQLIEEGYEVIATDAWPDMRRHLRQGRKPRLAVVDLKALPDPRTVLEALRVLMKPQRVLVLTASATVSDRDLAGLGFRVIQRPVRIAEIVSAIRDLVPRPAER